MRAMTVFAGPVLFVKNLKGLVQFLEDVLNFKAPCQVSHSTTGRLIGRSSQSH